MDKKRWRSADTIFEQALQRDAGTRDEFLLAATVQNLKRLIARVAIPPPIPKTA